MPPALPPSRLATAAALAAVALGVLGIHGHLLAGTKEVFTRDLNRIFLPAAHALQPRLERWTLPEWEPGIACGQPLVGLGQSQAFYPPRWLQLVVGPDRIFSLLAALHPLLAAIACFALARRLGRSAPASTVAGLVAGATPLLFSSINTPNLHYAACWAPVTILLGVRCAQTQRLLPAALAGTTIGLATLVGAFEIAFASGLAFVGAAVLTVPSRRLVIHAAIAALIAGLVAAPELLPVLEHARHGSRAAGLTLEKAALWSAGGPDLLSMAWPRILHASDDLDLFWKEQWLFEEVYLGATAVALAALGAWAGGARRWLALGALFVILSLGVWGGLFALLHFVPGFDRMRFPVKFLLMLPPIVGVAAAYGLDALSTAGRRWLPLAAAVATLSLAMAPWRVAIAPALAVLALALPLPAPRRAWLAVGAVLLDLGTHQALTTSGQFLPSGEQAALAKKLPAIEARYRLLDGMSNQDWSEHEFEGKPSEFISNFPQAAGIRLASGYGPNVSLATKEVCQGGPGARDLVGARWLFTKKDSKPDGALRAEYAEAALYARETALPRGLFFERWEVVGGEDAKRRVTAPEFDPRPVVLLDRDPGLGAPQGEASAAPVPLREDRAERIALQVEGKVPGLAVLQDSWDSGWSATVDGAAAQVLRADHAFLAAPVPAGRHEVVFSYRSRPLRFGLWLATAGLALVGGAFALDRRRRPWKTD